MAKKNPYANFAVLGLGHFGMSVVRTLSEHGVSIMACDKDETQLRRAADCATHLVQVDIADEIALEKLELGSFEVVILAAGEDFVASQTAAMIAKESGARYVIAKARDNRQKTILERVGVDEVILPDHEMGAKLARKLVGSNIMDILEESSLYTITEMRPMDEWLNKTVQESDIRRRHGLVILAIRQGDKLKIPVLPDMTITAEDILITLSENKK